MSFSTAAPPEGPPVQALAQWPKSNMIPTRLLRLTSTPAIDRLVAQSRATELSGKNRRHLCRPNPEPPQHQPEPPPPFLPKPTLREDQGGRASSSMACCLSRISADAAGVNSHRASVALPTPVRAVHRNSNSDPLPNKSRSRAYRCSCGRNSSPLQPAPCHRCVNRKTPSS